MKQYDFIYDILRDPRFRSKSGHIFTEIGRVGMQSYLNEFMLTDSLSETEVHNRIIHMMRNVAVGPVWTKFNTYKYFKRLYHLNQKLSPEDRIQHHYTDSELDWSTITTKNEYDEHKKKYIWNRDEIMANTIIKEMERLADTSEKEPKALVIMNYRHAMDLTDRLQHVKRKNTFEFIKDSLGDRAANVLINSRILAMVPVAGGVWDAAFEKTGNTPLGFDFQGSPFGASFLDMFPFNTLFRPFDKTDLPTTNGSLRYRDVFTGFVFTHPTKDQYFEMNTPKIYDGFKKEYIRRSTCLGIEFSKEVNYELQSFEDGGFLFSNESPFDFIVETGIELFLYFFISIGLLIGMVSFIYRPKY